MNKILVIGCGSIGQRHIEVLIKLGENNIAALRTYKGYRKELNKKIKDNVIVFTNEIDAFKWKPTHVIISNPTKLHAEYIKKFLDTDINIFVEKPILSDLKDIEKFNIDLKKIALAKGTVGYDLRFFSITERIKEIIQNNIYGNVISANINVGHYLPFWHTDEDYRKSYTARYDLGGGVLRTLSHEIDLSRHFFGNTRKVFAKVEKLSSLEIDVDDTVDIIMETDLCRRVTIHLDYLNPKLERNGKIQFENGILSYNYISGILNFTDYIHKETEKIYEIKENYNEPYTKQMKHFLLGNSKVACSLIEGIKIMETIFLCEESSKKGVELCPKISLD